LLAPGAREERLFIIIIIFFFVFVFLFNVASRFALEIVRMRLVRAESGRERRD